MAPFFYHFMKHAILIDGGFLKPLFRRTFSRRIEAVDVCSLAKELSSKHADNCALLRIYYYDSPPLDVTKAKPITGSPYNFKNTDVYRHQQALFSQLKTSDFVSVREGTLKFRGWELKGSTLRTLRQSGNQNASLTDDSFQPNIQQKGVDTKLGLDMAWITFCHVAERVIIVTGDSDFVPAIKAARRNGVQVTLCSLAHGITKNLKNNVDVLDTTPIDVLFPSSP